MEDNILYKIRQFRRIVFDFSLCNCADEFGKNIYSLCQVLNSF